MVNITSTGKSDEEVRDIAGNMAGTALDHDDPANAINLVKSDIDLSELGNTPHSALSTAPADAHHTPTENVPDWVEDGNSPQTATNTGSITYTLAGSYDLVRVQVQIVDAGSQASPIDLRANGDSGGNYFYIDNDDSITNSASQIDKITEYSRNDSLTFQFQCAGRWTDRWTGGMPVYGEERTQAVGWSNTSITSPLDSFELFNPESFDIRLQVYGKDIGGAGLP